MAGRLSEPSRRRPSWAAAKAAPVTWRAAGEIAAGEGAGAACTAAVVGSERGGSELQAAHEETWRWLHGAADGAHVAADVAAAAAADVAAVAADVAAAAVDVAAAVDTDCHAANGQAPSDAPNSTVLEGSLHSSHEPTRLSAAIRLGRAGHVEPLMGHLRESAERSARTYLSGADTWTEGDPAPKHVEGFFGRRWLEGSAYAGLAAAGAAAAEHVGTLIQDPSLEKWSVRAAAARALAEMGRGAAPAAPALRAALRDPDEWVALSAAEALGLLGPSADGSNELALADALLHPVVKPARWPFHRDPMRGKWPLVALARLAGQPGFDDLPAHVRSAVDAAFAAASEEGGPDGASSVRLRSGPAWWAALGKQRAAAMGS